MIIKKAPEGFVVTEMNTRIKQQGKHTVYILEKCSRNTEEIVRIIEHKFNCKIKYSGTKDRNAITRQFISTNKVIPEISEKDFSLKKIGGVDEPLSLGSHEGNSFKILVDRIVDVTSEMFFPNYFGEQRFGKNNVVVAEALLNRDWKKAVGLVDNKKCNAHLTNSPNDYLGALKKIPLRTLRLILTSYQSANFNKKLSQSLVGIPILVANQELFFPEQVKNSSETAELVGWDNGDRRFLFNEYPELSLEGDERKKIVTAKNVKFENNYLCFDLPKSSYATIFLRHLFKEEILSSE